MALANSQGIIELENEIAGLRRQLAARDQHSSPHPSPGPRRAVGIGPATVEISVEIVKE